MRVVFSNWQRKLADGVDRLTLAVSPKGAHLGRACRFAYDTLDRSRTRKPRTGLGSSSNAHLADRLSINRARELTNGTSKKQRNVLFHDGRALADGSRDAFATLGTRVDQVFADVGPFHMPIFTPGEEATDSEALDAAERQFLLAQGAFPELASPTGNVSANRAMQA